MTKNFSAMASYCKVTGVAIAVTAQFGGTALSRQRLPALHPVLEAPLPTLLEVSADYLQRKAGSPTEHYVLVAAVLWQLGLVVAPTSGKPSPVTEDGMTKVWKVYTELLVDADFLTLVARVVDGKSLQGLLPTLCLREQPLGSSLLLGYLTTLREGLSSAVAVLQPSAIVANSGAPKTALQKLVWEIELERQLKEVMQEGSTTRYNAKARKQVLKQLLAEESCSEVQYRFVHRALTEQVSDEVLKEAIAICSAVLDLHSTAYRESNLVTIRHLEGLLAESLKQDEDFGFILLEEESGAAYKSVRYKVKTKATELTDIMVSPTKVDGKRLSFAEQLELRKQIKAQAKTD